MSNNISNQSEYRLDFSDLWVIFLRRKWLIIIPVIITSITAYLGLPYITPEYESSVILLMDRSVRLSHDIRTLIGEGTGWHEEGYMELNGLRNEVLSPPIMRPLISKYNLDNNPELNEIVAEILLATPNLDIEQAKYNYLVGQFGTNIDIQYAGLNQIKIILRSSNPFLARDYVQTIGELFISEKMRQQRGVIHSTDDFTYNQLERYERDLQDKIDRRTQLQIEYNKIYNEGSNFYFSNQNTVRAEIISIDKDIEEYNNNRNNILRQLSPLTEDSLSLERSSLKTSLNNEIDNFLGSYSDLVTKFDWGASDILNLKTRISLKLSDLKSEYNRQIADRFGGYGNETVNLIKRYYNAQSEYDFAVKSKSALKAALNSVTEIADNIPAMQAELEQIDREIVSAQLLRDKFKTQQEGSTISLAFLQESKYKIIEPAKVPISPFKPDKRQILLIGFMLGLVIGGSSALLAELLDKTIRKTSEIEKLLGFPIIGVIPKIKQVSQRKF